MLSGVANYSCDVFPDAYIVGRTSYCWRRLLPVSGCEGDQGPDWLPKCWLREGAGRGSCVCICVYIYIYIYIVYVCVNVYIYIYIYIYREREVHMLDITTLYACVCIYIYIYIYVSTVCMWIYEYIYIYIYIHTQRSSSSSVLPRLATHPHPRSLRAEYRRT